jgi:hypothetical protein
MEVLISGIMNECDNSPFADCNYLASLFEKEQLIQLEKKWEAKKAKKSLLEFVRVMVGLLQHNNEDLLFLVMGLIDLYREVQALANTTAEVALADVTNFICSSGDPVGDLPTKIQEFRVPDPKKVGVNKARVRAIDIEAPRVVGFKEGSDLRIRSGKVITDSVKHVSQCV